MTIRFLCANCGKKLKADESLAGARVRCTGCHTAQLVPAPAGAILARAAPSAAPSDDGPVSFPVPHKQHEELVDMTAMVDVTFFLLIYFMVTSVTSLLASLEMPTPDPQQSGATSAPALETESDAAQVTVRIDRDNTIFVNEREATTRQEVIALIREARDADATSMIVEASGEATHGSVVMALDAGPAAGMENVRLASANEDDF